LNNQVLITHHQSHVWQGTIAPDANLMVLQSEMSREINVGVKENKDIQKYLKYVVKAYNYL